VIKLPQSGLNPIELSPGDFLNEDGETLKDWDEICELYFTPANRIKSRLATSENWKGNPPQLKVLRWNGGRFINRPHPHQPRGTVNTAGRISFDEEFQNAIDKSVELEKVR